MDAAGVPTAASRTFTELAARPRLRRPPRRAAGGEGLRPRRRQGRGRLRHPRRRPPPRCASMLGERHVRRGRAHRGHRGVSRGRGDLGPRPHRRPRRRAAAGRAGPQAPARGRRGPQHRRHGRLQSRRDRHARAAGARARARSCCRRSRRCGGAGTPFSRRALRRPDGRPRRHARGSSSSTAAWAIPRPRSSCRWWRAASPTRSGRWRMAEGVAPIARRTRRGGGDDGARRAGLSGRARAGRRDHDSRRSCRRASRSSTPAPRGTGRRAAGQRRPRAQRDRRGADASPRRSA